MRRGDWKLIRRFEPRPEFPEPQFQREQWLNLNGRWEFEFDDANAGLAEKDLEIKAPPDVKVTHPLAALEGSPQQSR